MQRTIWQLRRVAALRQNYEEQKKNECKTKIKKDPTNELKTIEINR